MKTHLQRKKGFGTKNILLFILIYTASYSSVVAQSCYGIDFETGTLAGWITSGNVSVVSAGTDIYGGFPLSAPGGSFSVKVGNNTDPTPSTLSKSFTVNASKPYITYKYAMDLLNYPHTSTDAGRVIIDVFDNSNNPISCAHYEALYSTNGGPQDFLISTQPGESNIGGECCYDISYKPWTSLTIDLTPYIGQQVTLKATCNWCIYDVDWAYAYFDFDCSDYSLKQDTTCNSIGALLVAPENFESYSWTGPGVVSGQNNDSAYVNQLGTYIVSMTTATGCVITKTLVVNYVPPVVTAAVSADAAVCQGDSVTLTSSGGLYYRWINTFYTDPAITVNPSVTTTYTIEVTDQFGCKDSASTTVEIYPLPSAAFASADVCIGVQNQFTNMSSIITGTVTGWSWSFGDNSALVNTQNPNHTYADTGSFSVKLLVSSNNGCKDSLTKTVIIHPLPEARLTTSNVCEGSIALLNDASSVPAPDIVQQWTWDFGDGSPFKNNRNTSHLYPATGSYTAKLIVTSNFGCKDSTTRNIVVNPNPTAHFSAPDTTNCSPLCADFQNTSAVSSGNIVSYVWSYGDGGNTANSEEGNYCYTNNTGDGGFPLPLNFTVSLTVTSDSGCTSSLTKNNYITVYPNPIADFMVDPQSVSIFNPGIGFTNLSSGVNTWNWDFGDTTTSIDQTPPLHVYSDTGKYTVQLIVANQYGCFDTTYRTITIEPDWAFFVPNVFTPNGDGINDTYQGFGYGLLDYNMSIYDRWGNHIYTTDDYDEPWDGKANQGQSAAQQDVYVYRFVISDIKNKKHVYTGTVTLVR